MDTRSKNPDISYMTIISITVPITVAVFTLIAFAFVYFCFCRKSESENDDDSEESVPASLVENAKKAEPRPSQRDKYLPENYDAAAFKFKGPLIIPHRPQFTDVHELDGDPPRPQSADDHVEFDAALNEVGF
ncbi:unnamed protein product [Anisakis simplex]|uniref:Cadherin_C domain-containing protein n=1 Tax=Anisakis simplex TaxID=6269 RepID=A0A0M3IZX8_ANISI|nr:unnamed protein product [Anisakis simplex]